MNIVTEIHHWVPLSPKTEQWEKIGECGVDSGMIMICDPCYIDENNQDLIASINSSISSMIENKKNFTQVNYPIGHEGLAVVSGTEVGDGVFEVFIRHTASGKLEIKIVFD